MARCYSLETMLRMVPRDLLREYFLKVVSSDLGLDWATLRKTNQRPILRAIKKLKKSEQDLFERQLQTIFNLACRRGIESLQEAASLVGDKTYLVDCHQGGAYAKAMWSFLYRDLVFQKAQVLFTVTSARWWRRRNDLPDFTGYAFSSVELARLQQGLAKFLDKEEGRGRRCTVEYMERDGKDYVLVHADDYPEEKLMHTRKGRLVSRTIRSTFLMVYELDRKRRSLQVDAAIPRRHKADLEMIFIGELFNYKLSAFVTPAYQIDQLKYDTMTWITEPRDAAEVKVLHLELQSLSDPEESIVVKTNPKLPAERIYSQMRQKLAEDVSQSRVIRTKIRFDFQAIDDRPASHVTFELTEKTSTFHPSKVGEERADVIERCLDKSGVMIHDRPALTLSAVVPKQPYSAVG
jgi:hypothetical protein